MAKRIDWEKRRFDQQPKMSIADETEFRKGDAAARWLEGAEQWEERKKKIAKARAKKRRRR